MLGYAVEVILLATWNNSQELESIGDQMLQGNLGVDFFFGGGARLLLVFFLVGFGISLMAC